MTVQKTLFAEIFALWPNAKALSRDMGLNETNTRAYQWVRRGYLDPWYWPRLIDVIEQRFGKIITHRQLVEAACEARGAETRRRNREGDQRSEAA